MADAGGLTDLGWDVHAVDLLGHGARPHAGPEGLTLDVLAHDVCHQVPGPVDVLVGHSLGALLALSVARLDPGYCTQVVIEDPPGLSDELDPMDVADSVEASVRAARADPSGTVEALLTENTSWSRRDAVHAVDSRQTLDLDHITGFLRTNRWALQDLVARCPVPVSLLAASRHSGLTEPDRSALFATLPQRNAVVVTSGHSIHRDRPALWLHHVLRFAEMQDKRPAG